MDVLNSKIYLKKFKVAFVFSIKGRTLSKTCFILKEIIRVFYNFQFIKKLQGISENFIFHVQSGFSIVS